MIVSQVNENQLFNSGVCTPHRPISIGTHLRWPPNNKWSTIVELDAVTSLQDQISPNGRVTA